MADLQIKSNESFSIDVTARESDKYTKSAFIVMEHNYLHEGIKERNEFFMTPAQLEGLGRYFIRKADEIKTAQAAR